MPTPSLRQQGARLRPMMGLMVEKVLHACQAGCARSTPLLLL